MGSLCSLLAQKKVREVTIYSQPAQFLGLIHFGAFFVAMALFAVFALKNIADQKPPQTKVPSAIPSATQTTATNSVLQPTNTTPRSK
jgi:hypothetical protein